MRPTSDRLRQTIFNILEHAYADAVEGARAIDLFAGTGALAFEALSRGASTVLLVETGSEALSLIRANMQALGAIDAVRVMRRDATRLGTAPGPPFTLAFLDPPYGRGLLLPALDGLDRGGWLAAGALCIVEEAARCPVALPAPYREVERRAVGDSQILIGRYNPEH